MTCARCKRPVLRGRQCSFCLRVLCTKCRITLRKQGNPDLVKGYRVICKVDCKEGEKP